MALVHRLQWGDTDTRVHFCGAGAPDDATLYADRWCGASRGKSTRSPAGVTCPECRDTDAWEYAMVRWLLEFRAVMRLVP